MLDGTMMEVTFEPFTEQDFADYQKWFSDPQMQAELGPVDDNYEVFVGDQDESKCINWAIREKDKLVCLLQVVRDGSTTEAGLNISVSPDRRRDGIAEAVMRSAISHTKLAQVRRFVGLVSEKNPASRKLLEKVGFVKTFPKPDANGYFWYALYR